MFTARLRSLQAGQVGVEPEARRDRKEPVNRPLCDGVCARARRDRRRPTRTWGQRGMVGTRVRTGGSVGGSDSWGFAAPRVHRCCGSVIQ